MVQTAPAACREGPQPRDDQAPATSAVQPLTGAEQLFWGEVRSPKSTQRSVAVCYALLIAVAASRKDFWPPIHAAIVQRFGFDSVLKIDPIKKQAWDVYEGAAKATGAA